LKRERLVTTIRRPVCAGLQHAAEPRHEGGKETAEPVYEFIFHRVCFEMLQKYDTVF
jgi:hypothetical protein